MSPENYKSERIKRGLSQAALAALVGVSRGCINYREAGHDRYPITVEAWLAICSLPAVSRKAHDCAPEFSKIKFPKRPGKPRARTKS